MKILIVGSGGREHALAWSFHRSNPECKIYCAKGNAGVSQIAECVPIADTEIDSLKTFAKENKIDLTFVGGETALALGIVDQFEADGLRIVGPGKMAAALESSKSFANDFMQRHLIPTAKSVTVESFEGAMKALEDGVFGNEDQPLVVKADGLAAGKGVVVCSDRSEAKIALEQMFGGELVSHEASSKVVLEECLFGKEVSLIAFCDGDDYILMPPTRDHKRIGEGDQGPNTGGMGTITDPSILSKEDSELVEKTIIKPTLEGAKKEGFLVKGIMFLGLMMTSDGPKVLEYNMRFGDPETQAILANLESDLYEICEAIIDKHLNKLTVTWKEGSSACVILAAEGYPQSPRKGDLIAGHEHAANDECVTVFHSGTDFDSDGNLITAGGRVLGVTATASNLSNAIHRAYKAANKISWKGMYLRRDIGHAK